MTTAELAKILKRLKISRRESYEIMGQTPRAADGSLVLKRVDGRWRAVVYERGQTDVLAEFADEDSACRWMYDQLVGPNPTIPRPRMASAARGAGPVAIAIARGLDTIRARRLGVDTEW